MITQPPEITNWFIISEHPLTTTGKDGYCNISFYCKQKTTPCFWFVHFRDLNHPCMIKFHLFGDSKSSQKLTTGCHKLRLGSVQGERRFRRSSTVHNYNVFK